LKRVILAAAATLACAALPASAVARGHESGREHAREHARQHNEGFGLRSETPGVAGRIVSHTGNTVAIRTLDGSVDTGIVTDATKVFCVRHTSSGSGTMRREHGRHEGFRDAAWARDAGLAIVPCSPGDITPGRRIAGALLAITPSGNVWKFIVVWD
jgi:RNase P/RNase MRP subunit p29